MSARGDLGDAETYLTGLSAPQSARIARMGSMEAARRAGHTLAVNTTRARRAAVAPTVTGSKVETP